MTTLLVGCCLCRLCGSGQCYPYPIWGCYITKNLFIQQCHQRLHSLSKLPYAFWQLAWLTWCWQSGLLHPVLQIFHVCQSLLWLLDSVILASKAHVVEWEVCIPVEAMGVGDAPSSSLCWRHNTVLWASEKMPIPSLQTEGMFFWPGTSLNSGHHTGVFTQRAWQINQWLLSSRDGSSVSGWLGSPSWFFAGPRWFLSTKEVLNLGI